ncbi:hypothetical protein AHAS_Ahas02G0241200 [Arachis hypogaea]
MKHGEVPTSFVVRANGHTDTTEDEIKQFVSKELVLVLPIGWLFSVLLYLVSFESRVPILDEQHYGFTFYILQEVVLCVGDEDKLIWNYLEDGSYLNKKYLKIETIFSSIWYSSDADIWWT